MHIPIQEFKSHLAKYIARAGSEGIDRMLATGAASWQGGKPECASIQLTAATRSAAQMVIEDRG